MHTSQQYGPTTPVSGSRSRIDPVILFFFLAYAISWLTALALHVVARQAGLPHFGTLLGMVESTFDLGTMAGQLILPVPVVWVMTRVVDFGPTLAGVITALIVGGTHDLKRLLARLVHWRVGVAAYVLALLGPAVVMLGAIGIYALADNSFVESGTLGWRAATQALVFWLAVRTLMGGGLGEELGWRGFALDRMLGRMHPNQASLIIGLVWTFWHFPGHLVSQSPVGNLIGQLLITVPLSYVATWLYLRTSGSVLVLTLFHGSANGFNSFFERSLWPGLRDADGWLLIFLVLALALSAAAAASMGAADDAKALEDADPPTSPR